MSGSNYLLDTNTVSFIMSGHSLRARQTFQARLSSSSMYISVLTQAEILFGLAKKPKATQRRATFEVFTGYVTILSWDSATAYASLRVSMSAQGKTLGVLDLLIAALALAANSILVTHDRAFANAGAELRLEDWATDLQ